MILVFGGAYQGKLDYALERFELTHDDVYRCSDDDSGVPRGKKIICGLERWILALVKEGADVEDAVRRFASENQSAVVTCADISCGVVPEDAALRKWREDVGRTLTKLARDSDEVIRVFCGIPSKQK